MAMYEGTGTGGRVYTNVQANKDSKKVPVEKKPSAPEPSAYEKYKERKEALKQRVDISEEQIYTFPSDLKDGADAGYPFIMFSVLDNKGTGKVDICLYQPPGFSVADGASYTNYDMGTLKGGLALTNAVRKGEGVTDADLFSLALIGKDKLLTSSTVDKITSAGAVSAGVATNPYTRTAYESTNIRSFSFSFKLVAQSFEESETAKAIERTFRKFLYPKRAGSIALVYPPLFKIRFFSEGKERPNPYMPIIKPCYLTGLETTFNSSTVAMHKDTGAPVEVDISLTFQEERVLVRQDLYETDNDIEEQEGYFKDGDMGALSKSADSNLIEKGVDTVKAVGSSVKAGLQGGG